MSIVPEQLLTKTAFGELSVAENDPEIQVNAQYNTPGGIRTIAISTGSTDILGGEYKASSGASVGGIAAIFSDRQIISRPGQGSIVRFAARFPDVADFSRAGPATASERMNFGYSNGVFGIDFAHLGEVIVQVLTLTVAATGSETATVGVNGQDFLVPLTSGTITHNCNEIADYINANTTLYNLTQNGDTVVLRSIFAAPSVAFTFSSSTAVGSWTELSNGILPTDIFTAQADWNIDTRIRDDELDPENLDPTKINFYTVRYNGTIDYFVQDSETGEDVLVHKFMYPNTDTNPMFSTAAFRISWSVRNLTTAANVDIFGCVGSASTEGRRVQTRSSMSSEAENLSVSTTLTNIISIRCREVFGTKVNLGRIIPKFVVGTTDATRGAIIEICKGVTFSGGPSTTGDTDFSYRDVDTSIAEIDTTANTVSDGDCIAAIPIGLASPAEFNLSSVKILILPGEILTVAIRVRENPSKPCSATLIWDEDV